MRLSINLIPKKIIAYAKSVVTSEEDYCMPDLVVYICKIHC